MAKKGKSKASKVAKTTRPTNKQGSKEEEELQKKSKVLVLISAILTGLFAVGAGIAFKNELLESLPFSLSSPARNVTNIDRDIGSNRPTASASSKNTKDPVKPLDASALPKKSSDVMLALAKAASTSNIITARTLAENVLESYNPTYMWKAAEQLHRATDPQMLELRVDLLRAAYDFIFGIKESVVSHPQTGRLMVRQHGDLDKRRITQLLGEAYENGGNTNDARNLYQKAIDAKLWALSDQRPQHFFPFIQPGLPFPHSSTYQEAVTMLETNFESMREELVMNKQQFPGNLKLDTEKLSVTGSWLQAEFLHQGRWQPQNAQTFPMTAQVLKTMSAQFANDLPDAVMQMSTLADGTEVRPHCGSGNHKVRLHLPLVVPPEGCGIQVANDTSHWELGKVLVIDDSYVHSVWNRSPKFRTVLIVDVWADGISETEKNQVRKYFSDRDAKLAAQRNKGK